VTLKNVPVELVTRLKEEARQNRRSLNQEALARLEASLAPRRGAAVPTPSRPCGVCTGGWPGSRR